MARHTEGPWNEHVAYPLSDISQHVDLANGGWEFWIGKVAKGKKIIGEARMMNSGNGFPTVTDLEEARANALLMIATPELLDALNGLLGLLVLIQGRSDMPKEIFDAINGSHRTQTAIELVERIRAGNVLSALEEAQLNTEVL